jgi:hypothetical protein
LPSIFGGAIGCTINEQNGQGGFPELVRVQPTVPRSGSRVTGSSIQQELLLLLQDAGKLAKILKGSHESVTI